MKKIRIVLFLLVFLVGCDLIKYHPYDSRTDLEDINATNIELILSNTAGKSSFSFVWMGDSQRFYDETEDFVSYVNKNLDVDFVLHGGDITDFGMADEFEWVHDIMCKLTVPYVALIGNHDIVGNTGAIFEQAYGADHFSFTVADVKFIAINNNMLEYENRDDIPDLEFVEQEVAATQGQGRIIGLMHAGPGSDQCDIDTGREVHERFMRYGNLICCMNAHGHSYGDTIPFEDGIHYHACAAMNKRSFILVNVTENDYTYEEIFF